ncbi:MAG: glycosyltransferase family 4 protein [Bacteroidales bacterium]
MAKDKILLVIPFRATFIKGDINILSKKYKLVINEYNWKNKYLTPIYILLQFFAVLRYIFSVKSIVVEFGGYWSLVPSILGKIFNVPVLIILHGTDCALMPHIGYGSLRKPLLKTACKLSYRFAKVLLPVSQSLLYIKNDYDSEYIEQGINFHFPKIKTATKVVSNGLVTDFWDFSPDDTKEPGSFITVLVRGQFMRKGGDLILKLAKLYPSCNFYIAGLDKITEVDNIPDNVHLLGRLSPEDLREEYRKAQYYLQLSMFEGFGLSLCEAMLCGCIPIGSSVNVIPDIIGDTGFILKKKDIGMLEPLIDKALAVENKKELERKARNRILTKYSIEKRAEGLFETIGY